MTDHQISPDRTDDRSFGRDDRKTATPADRGPACPISTAPDGTLTIASHALAQQVLRSRASVQAGFNADLVRRLPQRNVSLLFRDGDTHRRQRAAVAPFFAPAAVATRYRAVMEERSRTLVEAFRRAGRAVLDEMTLDVSVGVAAALVGLTDSARPGLGRRLSRILAVQSLSGRGLLRSAWYIVCAQAILLRIYLLDVRPAIRARRRERRPDLVSSLLDQGWSRLDILTECVTYGTAGISTTREFMVVAALHLLERDALRRRFLGGEDEDRIAILAEILRLEPAVSTLYRRTVEALPLGRNEGDATIPPGRRVAIDIRAVNADPDEAGACPFELRPDREVRTAGLMSFGDGHHRCPGAAVALLEAAIFLDHLLRVPGLRVVSGPTISRHPVSTGYVLRGVVIEAGG